MTDERRGVSLAPTAWDELTDQERALITAYRRGTLNAWLAGYASAPGPAQGLLRLALAGVGVLLGTLLVLAMTLGLLTAISVVATTGQAVGSVGARVESTFDGIGAVLGTAFHSLAERVDPTLPPRGPLTLDPEFAAIRQVGVGEVLARTGDYELALTGIRRREGAATAEGGQYAIITGRLQTPREIRILGMLVHTDDGTVEHYLDQGESFRIGAKVYKVNWIARERGIVAIAEYREPDRVTVAVDFAYD